MRRAHWIRFIWLVICIVWSSAHEDIDFRSFEKKSHLATVPVREQYLKGVFRCLFPSSWSTSFGYPPLSSTLLLSTIQLSIVALLTYLKNQQKEMENETGTWRGSTMGDRPAFLVSFLCCFVHGETLGEYPPTFSSADPWVLSSLNLDNWRSKSPLGQIDRCTQFWNFRLSSSVRPWVSSMLGVELVKCLNTKVIDFSLIFLPWNFTILDCVF